MSRLDYSKWNNIEVSDDEDDTHPNIDTASLFRWRHQARVERMEEQEKEKSKLKKEETDLKKKSAELQKKTQALTLMDDTTKKKEAQAVQEELKELKRQEQEFKKKEAEISKKERLTPWNVDTLSKPGFEKTIVNVPKAKPTEVDEESRHKQMFDFIGTHEQEIKKFGMLGSYDASRDYLRDNPHLVCIETANYLTMWCVNLEVEEKSALMKRVAHQTIVMQYILELAKQLDRDPRSCAPGFFMRMRSAEKTYLDAFEDELQGFIKRVEGRAKARYEEAAREAEEEARQKRLGPGGLDPVEVMETLPQELKECFASRNIPKLQEVLAKMSKEEAAYHMKRCVDSGLWVSDAKAAGLTPASEELRKMKEDGTLEASSDQGEEVQVKDRVIVDDDEIYETIESDDLGLD